MLYIVYADVSGYEDYEVLGVVNSEQKAELEKEFGDTALNMFFEAVTTEMLSIRKHLLSLCIEQEEEIRNAYDDEELINELIPRSMKGVEII